MRLRLVPQETNIPFLSARTVAVAISGALMIAALLLFFIHGVNKGIDFEGGILIEVRAPQPVNVADYRSAVADLGIGDVSVQEFGQPTDVLIRIGVADEPQEISGEEQEAARQALVSRVQNELTQEFGELEFRRVEFVGPVVSDELMRDGFLAIGFAVIAVLIYIWFRFEWHFGVGAVAALIHDVALTLGFFSLTGLEFNLSIIAAILTIVGYSLNDTVVVYDRVRENMRKFTSYKLEDVLNMSLNQTLSRTLMTSITTLVALLALFIFGGPVIRGFTAAMIWGVFVGTYSSVFVASPVLMYLGLNTGHVSHLADERP